CRRRRPPQPVFRPRGLAAALSCDTQQRSARLRRLPHRPRGPAADWPLRRGSLRRAALPHRRAVILVLAASSLTDAFRAIQPEFEKATPGVRLRLEFGASSTLRAQI